MIMELYIYIINLIVIYISIITIFILMAIKPYISRKEILFAVRLPEELIDSEKTAEIKKWYLKHYLLICGIYTVIFFIALGLILDNIVLLPGLALLFLISFLIYYSAHKKALKIKRENPVPYSKKEVVVIDTNFRNNKSRKFMLSPLWFLIPVAIAIINIIIGFAVYDSLPSFIPTHWNGYGQMDGAVIKSYGIIMLFPLEQLFITAVLFCAYKAIMRSKQNINALTPKSSSERDRLFRYRWSVFMIACNIFILIVLSVLNLYIFQVIDLPLGLIICTEPLLFIIILTSRIFMSLWLGQGGSRIKLNLDENRNGRFEDIDDDKYWKLGLIYFNKEDPAVFVEKRFGTGWVLNLARFKSYALLAGSILCLFTLNIALMLLAY